MMVLNRWAINIEICSLAFEISLIVLVISSSVIESSAEVASSKIKRCGFLSKARAIESRCFSPPLNLSPPSPIKVSNPFSAREIKLAQLAFCKTSFRLSSVAVGFTNNKFSLIVPLNKLVS